MATHLQQSQAEQTSVQGVAQNAAAPVVNSQPVYSDIALADYMAKQAAQQKFGDATRSGAETQRTGMIEGEVQPESANTTTAIPEENVVASEKNDGTIGMCRNKDITNRYINNVGLEIIDEPTFNKITKKVRKMGALIIKGDSEATTHLERANATAACLGDILLFRDDATVSDVLEEVYHFKQNRIGLNNDKESVLRIILNEIDAKEYVLLQAKKYKISQAEIEITKAHLEYYKNELKSYMKEKDYE